MRLFKRIIPVCLVLLVCAAASAAASLKVGVILPLTGPQAEMGRIEKRSFELAVKLLYPDQPEPAPDKSNSEPIEKTAQMSGSKSDSGDQGGPGKPKEASSGKPNPPGGKTKPAGESESKAPPSLAGAPDEAAAPEDRGAEAVSLREKIELVFADDGSDPDQAAAAVNRLIDRDKVVVITGGHSSRATAAACDAAQKRGVPFLISTASADDLTRADRENIFRLSPPSGTYFSGLIGFLSTVVKPETAIVILEDNPFGQAGLTKIAELARQVGFRVVGTYPFRSGIGDFRDTLITNLPKNKVDLCFLVTGAVDGAIILAQAAEMGFQPGLYIGAAMGFADPVFRQNGREEADYLVTPVLWQHNLPFFGASAYQTVYHENFQQIPDYHGAEAFASVQVLGQALKLARERQLADQLKADQPREKEPLTDRGKADRPAGQGAPIGLKATPNPVEELTPADLRRALGEVEMMTVFGPVKFVNADGWYRQNLPPTYLAQWLKGSLIPVWPEQIAVQDYVFPIPGWLVDDQENKDADQTGLVPGSTKD